MREPRRRWKHRARNGRRNLADERQRGYGTTLQSTVAAPAFVFWLLCYRGRRGFEGCKRSAVGFPPLPWRALPRIGPPRGRASILANQARRKGRGLPKDGLKEKRPKTWRRPVGLKPSARSMAGRCRRANFPTPARRRCYRSLLAGPRSKAPFIGCLSYRVFRSMFVVITRAGGGAKAPPAFFIPGQW